MEDRIMYRDEWYNVVDYHDDSVTLADSIGMQFIVDNFDLQLPTMGNLNV